MYWVIKNAEEYWNNYDRTWEKQQLLATKFCNFYEAVAKYHTEKFTSARIIKVGKDKPMCTLCCPESFT